MNGNEDNTSVYWTADSNSSTLLSLIGATTGRRHYEICEFPQ